MKSATEPKRTTCVTCTRTYSAAWIACPYCKGWLKLEPVLPLEPRQ